MTLVRQTGYMTVRHLRELLRQPWFVGITLVQPVICSFARKGSHEEF